MKNIGLYIHVPFCSAKCPYCDFFSVKAGESSISEYTEFMCRKLRSYKGKYSADTVYLGGGTPSILKTERLCAILSAARDSFGSAGEVTIEVNPRSAMELDFKELRRAGLNRVSMGLQSASDSELLLLGRRHTAADAENAFKKIRSEGISNISLDLMLGISGQTRESLARSIDFCAELGAQHISAYLLKIEDGTLYARRRDSLSLPDEETVCDLYELAVERLAQRGFSQYEISNFSRPGFESRHNLKYWRCEEYLGLGPAAHSFLDGRRFYFDRSFDDFYGGVTVDDGEGGGSEEYIALALRLSEGLSFDAYRRRFKEQVPKEIIKNADKLKNTGLLYLSENGVALTPKGFLCSNAVIAEILYS